jgi:GGDEF domain-containing protein
MSSGTNILKRKAISSFEKLLSLYTTSDIHEYKEYEEPQYLSSRSFKVDFEVDIIKAINQGQPLSVLMLTVEEIEKSPKFINSNIVLQKVARILNGYIKSTDRKYYYGKGCLIVILPDVDYHQAGIIKHRIIHKIETVLSDSNESKLLTSFAVRTGVASITETINCIDELIQAARYNSSLLVNLCNFTHSIYI